MANVFLHWTKTEISTENQVNHQVKQKCVKIGILKKSFRVQNKFFLLWMNAYSVFNRFHMFYEKNVSNFDDEITHHSFYIDINPFG